LRRFGEFSSAFVSGWMNIRGMRRRRNVDRGFVLSDHADWSSLLKAVSETQAQRVLVTHGYIPMLVRFLREQGVDASGLSTRFEGEQAESDALAGAAREQAEQEALDHVGEDSAMEQEMVAAASPESHPPHSDNGSPPEEQ
jgi:putative mRNA 3-end processing factor